MPKKPARRVREPIQVYLDADERALLDRVASETGLSRAEVLRRGLRRYAVEQSTGRSPMLEFLDYMESRSDLHLPTDLSERHDDYLAEAYLDTHEA
ncbi:MAG TPA: ribbon-helix-helix protein, CopG family [Gemmatimonadales bacterium]|jgi:hypothetical protein